MDYLKNHCWCRSSHWNEDNYDCSIIVSLNSYKDGYKEDWNNLMVEVEVFDQERYDQHLAWIERCKDLTPNNDLSIDIYKNAGLRTIRKLKPEVMDWLEDNIPDLKGEKAWCVGSDKYNLQDSCSSYSIFMQRRKDAMKFIKTWSKFKKPINYCQYFTDVRKKLDLATLKYN